MSVALSPEEVGVKIVEWYSCIIARSVEQSIQLKEEVDGMIEQMEPNDRMLSYYSLVAFRHHIMMNQVGKGGKDNHAMQQASTVVENSMDHLLKYLYFFVSGQNEFMNERYRSAIRLFRKAERLLENIEDKAEKADFHYYMGSSLYRISQYPYAASHIEEALLAFKHLGFTERVVFCQVILGGIYSETGEHKKASILFKEAMLAAENHSTAKVIALRALGLNAVREKNYRSAKHYFEEALSVKELSNHILGAKSEHDLANTLYRMNLPAEAEPHLKKAYTGAQYFDNHEYKAKCLATTGLYVASDPSLIDKALKDLEDRGMDFEVDEIAEEASTFFAQIGREELALKYLKIAYHARQNFFKLGVDQE